MGLWGLRRRIRGEEWGIVGLEVYVELISRFGVEKGIGCGGV